eukprot:jgi/Psemu1/321974/estExt_fgenesh1_pg.C_150016
MNIRSAFGFVLLWFLLEPYAEAQHHKSLLKTNALGYTKDNKKVAYSDNKKVVAKAKGSCVNGPPPNPIVAPNVQTTAADSTCQALGACHIGFTTSGDWVGYDFEFSDEDLNNYKDKDGKLPIEVVIRAAAGSNKQVDMKIYTDHESKVAQQSVIVPGKGFQNFNDVAWKDIKLDPDEKHLTLYIFFSQGSTNLCSIDIRIASQAPTKTVPVTWAAFDYDDAYDSTPTSYQGNCHNMDRDDGVDGSYTFDQTCHNRDSSKCNIGWTRPGEWLLYQFDTDQDGRHDIRVRVATSAHERKIKLVLTPTNGGPSGKEMIVPSYGWTTYSDVIWENVYLHKGHYELQVYFTTGSVNLCSTAVYRSNSSPTRNPTPHPTRKPTRKPTGHPGPSPTRHPTPHPTYGNCFDDEHYHITGFSWKDCKWVAANNRCNSYDQGVHIGKNKCRKTCGYCHITDPPSSSPTASPSRWFHFPHDPTTKPPTPTRKPTPQPTSAPTHIPTSTFSSYTSTFEPTDMEDSHPTTPTGPTPTAPTPTGPGFVFTLNP